MKRLGILLIVAALSTAGYADLRAYWTFDEASGDYALDSSGNGNTGLLVADTTYGADSLPLGPTTKPDRITGVRGTGALQFCAGDSNYNSVWVAKSDSLKDLMGYWSFSMWLREDNKDLGPAGGGYDRLISCPNYEIELGAASWNYDYFWPYGTSAFQTDIGASYTALGGGFGQWYHMAVTYDGQNLKKYLNGQLVDTTPIANQGINNIWDDSGWAEAVLKLGCQTWPNKDWFEGAMDDVAIWGGQSLTADQVMGLYTGALTPLSIPEPATLTVLALGGLWLGRRKA